MTKTEVKFKRGFFENLALKRRIKKFMAVVAFVATVYSAQPAKAEEQTDLKFLEKETQTKIIELKEKNPKEFNVLFAKIKEAQDLIKYLQIKTSTGKEFWEAFPIVFSQSKELTEYLEHMERKHGMDFKKFLELIKECKEEYCRRAFQVIKFKIWTFETLTEDLKKKYLEHGNYSTPKYDDYAEVVELLKTLRKFGIKLPSDVEKALEALKNMRKIIEAKNDEQVKKNLPDFKRQLDKDMF